MTTAVASASSASSGGGGAFASAFFACGRGGDANVTSRGESLQRKRERECIRFENVRAVLSAFATTGLGPRAHLHLFYPPNSIDLAGLFGEFSS